MERRYARASSHHFFTTFEGQDVMPLEGLSAAEQDAFHAHVVPLLETHGAGLDAVARAVQHLAAALEAQPDAGSRQALYERCSAAADYVMSPYALVLVAAAAWLVSVDGRATADALRRLSADLYEGWLREDLAQQLLQAGLGDQIAAGDSGTLAASLAQWPATAGAVTAEAGNGNAHCVPPPDTRPLFAGCCWQAFQALVLAARGRHAGFTLTQRDRDAAPTLVRLPPGHWLKQPALKRAVQHASCRMVYDLLSSSPNGSVVLAGEALATVLTQTLYGPPAPSSEGPGDFALMQSLVQPPLELLLVGFPTAAAAAACVQDCLRQLESRWRHVGAFNTSTAPQALPAWLVGTTLWVRVPMNPPVDISFHLRNHATMAHALLSLDAPSYTRLAYDGTTVWATPTAAHALASGVHLADTRAVGTAAAAQLALAALQGWQVAVPLDAGAHGALREALADAVWAPRPLPDGAALARLLCLHWQVVVGGSVAAHAAQSRADLLGVTAWLGLARGAGLERDLLLQVAGMGRWPWIPSDPASLESDSEAVRKLAPLRALERWMMRHQGRDAAKGAPLPEALPELGLPLSLVSTWSPAHQAAWGVGTCCVGTISEDWSQRVEAAFAWAPAAREYVYYERLELGASAFNDL